MATFPTQYVPTTRSRIKMAPRVLSVAFGDGYAQEGPDGLNNNPREWSLVWIEDYTDSKAIGDFLDARAGHEIFDWTPPEPYDGASVKVKCPEWDFIYDSGQLIGVQAVFKQRFVP